MTIRVAIIDDHALVRDGLRRMLSAAADLEVVGEGADGAEAIDLVARARPDVLLLDLSMPGKDGVEAAAELSHAGWSTRILILTMYSEVQYAERAFRAGASGFIGKSVSFEELVRAVTAVNAGERYIPPELGPRLVKTNISAAPHLERPPPLTGREEEVLRLLAAGMTNREIATRLGVSTKTIDSHRGHVLKKLRLRNNADLTRYAIRHRLVPC